MSDDTNPWSRSHPSTDEYLQALVQGLEERDFPGPLAVTLLVGGALVSGTVATREEYVQSTVNRDAELIREYVEQVTGEPASLERPPLYIHLRDIQIWLSVLGKPVHLNWWRG